ncbi:MAG: cytochrome D1 domain-containing protein [Acidobacteriaceae bacterium]
MLLVANQHDRTLSIIDPVTEKQIVAIPVGGVTGHEVAVSPDGRTAYVPIYGDSGVGKPGTDGSTMSVIDLATRKVTATVDFGHGVRPHKPVLSPLDGQPRNRLLYVTTELDQTISAIDPRTLKIVATIPTGQEQSHMFVLSPDGRHGYTANVGPGTVSVLDMTLHQTLAVIPVSSKIQRISISTHGQMLFTSDQAQPRLAVINAATYKIEDWVPLPGLGYGTAPTPDGRWLLVAIPAAGKVAVIDLRTLKVAHTLDVPSAPQEILIRPDGKVAYVSCNASHKVAAINLSNWKVEALIDAGNGADGLAWAN